MELLAFIGLAAWVWWQQQRIGALTRKLDQLEARLNASGKVERTAQAAPSQTSTPATSPAQEREPLILDTPLPPETDEPLLLDTPVPDASNDDAALAYQPPQLQPRREPLRDEPDPPIPFPPKAATPPPRVSTARRLEKWIAENGLAWLGGGLMALGGIFFVSFATQQSWFTPQVQMLCALAFGTALVAGSEWARRLADKRPPGSPLVAAMLAGAGVVTFYATAWAAHGLYHLIKPISAGLMLGASALVLGTLSLRHGQALGVLAVVMALMAPPFASMGLWPTTGLTLYVTAIAAAGFGLAAWRRWAWVAAATATGLYFWFAAAIATTDIPRALTMASLAALGGVAMVFRKPLAEEPANRLPWARVHADLPAIAICASSVLLVWAWLSIAEFASGNIARVAWVGAMFVVLAAAAVRARAAAPASIMVSTGSLVFGVFVFLLTRGGFPPLGPDFYPFVLFSSLVVAISALLAKPHRSERTLVAASGAAGATLLAVFAAFTRELWHSPQAWAPLFTTAAILLACAERTARNSSAAQKNRAVAWWAGAATALLFLGIESAFPAFVRSGAYAGAALLLAFGSAWRGWRIFRFGALTAAAVAIAHALSGDLTGAAIAGALPLWQALLVLSSATLLLFAGSRVSARSESHTALAEGLSAASIVTALIGGFVTLRWFAAGGAGAPLDAFTETSLQALALIATGHIVLPRSGDATGLIAKWRGHVLMGFGLLHTLLSPALAAHPWWGSIPAAISGPPIFNSIALAFAAPAALALATARRLYDRQRIAARIFASTGGFLGLVWALSEVRRLFQGEAMAAAPIGVFEGACYALAFLGAALAVAAIARVRMTRHADGPFTQDLNRIMRGTAWACIVIAALLMLIVRHPWWGAQTALESDSVPALLATLAQAGAVVLSLALGRVISQSERVEKTRFAAASAAAVFAWSFGHSAIRWVHHQGAMDDHAALTGLEGFAHALWPLALVLGASALTTRAAGKGSERPYRYDFRAIWASAIWPALVFAALGLWGFFNPWWGAAPTDMTAPFAPFGSAAAFGAAALMSARAAKIPLVQAPVWLARTRTIATTGHLFVAATLAARFAFHRDDMTTGAVGSIEMWAYSAVWALAGAAVFALGVRRGDALLRWIGLGLLLVTTVKVFLFDMAQLSGVIRVGSFVGLGALLLGIAWAARRASGSAAPRK